MASTTKNKNKHLYQNEKFTKSKERRTKTSGSSMGSMSPAPAQNTERSRYNDPWMPAGFTVFKALLSARLCAAIWSNISDCDETYNYWEPMHYILHGSGFQTWEYSPIYAIRSYAYLWIHVLPLKVYSEVILANKVLQFYFLRCILAFVCTVCEVYFYKGVCQHFGANIGRITAVFLVFSSGLYISSAALLPSSFAMYMTMLAMSAWFKRNYNLAILAIAAGSIIAWPFVGALGIPIAIDVLIVQGRWKYFLKWCVVALLLFLIPLSQIDSHYYGGLVIAPLNIVLYNVFTSHGANLYGVEPWYFYFLNGFLNFNVVFILSLFAFPLAMLPVDGPSVVATRRSWGRFMPNWLALSPMYIWLAIFMFMKHKEERFLFPIYPLFCLTASFVVDYAQRLYNFIVKGSHHRRVHYTDKTNWISVTIMVVFSIISVSRTMALFYGYHAPLEIYGELLPLSENATMHTLSPDKSVNLCVGKEWYRYPSSFFLPSNKWQLQFLESEFKGQLPQPYTPGLDGTRVIPKNMNDANLQEKSRFIDLNRCQYIIDVDTDRTTELEPRYSERSKEWKILSSAKYLDAQRSHRFFRAFYIPYISEMYTHYDQYSLLQSTRLRKKTI